jgi:enhancing lycopene biosynthesis protein 2
VITTRGRRVWVLLSGSGLHDGTEVHEASLVELSLARLGAKVSFCAPDVAQPHVVDHLRGDLSRHETRSALIESARIARGPVEPVASVDLAAVDALVIPGGFGAVKTLCDYAFRARAATVQRDVAAMLAGLRKRGAPVGSMCMGNVLVARAFGAERVELALGWDPSVDADCAAWGARPSRCDARSAVIDRAARVASTPAFSASHDIAHVWDGIDRAMKATLELC